MLLLWAQHIFHKDVQSFEILEVERRPHALLQQGLPVNTTEEGMLLQLVDLLQPLGRVDLEKVGDDRDDSRGDLGLREGQLEFVSNSIRNGFVERWDAKGQLVDKAAEVPPIKQASNSGANQVLRGFRLDRCYRCKRPDEAYCFPRRRTLLSGDTAFQCSRRRLELAGDLPRRTSSGLMER